jgi:hypothetical protein
VIGLHQTSEFRVPHLTYFAADMAERITALRAAGIPVEPLAGQTDQDAGSANGMFAGPGGELFFLFQGDI